MRCYSIAVGIAAVLSAPLCHGWQLRKSTRVPTSSRTLVPSKGQLFPSAHLAAQATASTEEWTKPRLHNTNAFRSAAILGAIGIAGMSTPMEAVSSTVLATTHLLSFATLFGMVVYTTFIAGITMFKNLPRQTFGKLQAKLFPKYFGLSSILLVLQLVTVKSLKGIATAKSTKALTVALVMTLLNQFLLEPTATNNMMRRYELEEANTTDNDEYKTLKGNFGKYHGLSSLTNLIGLCAATAHGIFLAAPLA